MKTALTFALLAISFGASAQTTTYSNQYGMPIGSSQTSGNTTTYSNQYGMPIGSAYTPPAPPVYTPPPQYAVPAYTPIQPANVYGGVQPYTPSIPFQTNPFAR